MTQIIVDLPPHLASMILERNEFSTAYSYELAGCVRRGRVLPECHGRLGDLDELEQRIRNFVERDAHMVDELTLLKEKFIIDGIKETPTIIEAGGGICTRKALKD